MSRRQYPAIVLSLLIGVNAGLAAPESDSAAQQRAASALDASAQALELDTINMQGEGTDGYLATRTSTATKTDTPLRDVPQSVAVFTKEQIKDIGAQKLEGVVRYMPRRVASG